MSNDRIYTITARDVVAGMIWVDWQGHECGIVAVDDEDGMPSICFDDGMGELCDADESVTIRLPGPSPRELLCSCVTGNGCGDIEHVRCLRVDAPVLHAKSCLVHYLRLRLWPVGATWQRLEDGAAYEVTVSGNRHLVEPHEIEAWCEVAPDMRAAFCEPEVTA